MDEGKIHTRQNMDETEHRIPITIGILLLLAVASGAGVYLSTRDVYSDAHTPSIRAQGDTRIDSALSGLNAVKRDLQVMSKKMRSQLQQHLHNTSHRVDAMFEYMHENHVKNRDDHSVLRERMDATIQRLPQQLLENSHRLLYHWNGEYRRQLDRCVVGGHPLFPVDGKLRMSMGDGVAVHIHLRGTLRVLSEPGHTKNQGVEFEVRIGPATAHCATVTSIPPDANHTAAGTRVMAYSVEFTGEVRAGQLFIYSRVDAGDTTRQCHHTHELAEDDGALFALSVTVHSPLVQHSYIQMTSARVWGVKIRHTRWGAG